MSSVLVRPLCHEDLDWTARLHRRGLRPSFFSALGPGYLRAYHATFVTSPHALALAATLDGDPAGFVLVTTNGPAHYRNVLRRSGLRLCCRGAAALLVRPALLVHFVSTRSRRYLRGARRLGRSTPKAAMARLQRPTAEIVHIVVEERARGFGVGSQLMSHVELAARGLGSEVLEAKTADAAAFYCANGWTRVGAANDLDGHQMDLLRRSLMAATKPS